MILSQNYIFALDEKSYVCHGLSFFMNKRRLIFFAVFGFYHVVLFLFTLYIDSQKNDFSILSKMLTSLPLFKMGRTAWPFNAGSRCGLVVAGITLCRKRT